MGLGTTQILQLFQQRNGLDKLLVCCVVDFVHLLYAFCQLCQYLLMRELLISEAEKIIVYIIIHRWQLFMLAIFADDLVIPFQLFEHLLYVIV